MSWFGTGGNNNMPEEAMDPDSAGKGRYAAPPTCPRCDLTKSQMTRTIQNYQKAYRKKVEGLKTELYTTRADNSHLRKQVKQLRRRKLVHLPSLVVGGAVGWLLAKHLNSLLQRVRGGKSKQTAEAAGGAAEGADALEKEAAELVAAE